MDLSNTIIPKSDQLNADDLVTGARTITIRDVKSGADEQQPVNIYFEGDNNKPYKPCKSMRRLLVQVWGVNSDVYIGRALTIYKDDDVKFGGVNVGGIRISHVSHIDAPVNVLLTVAKSKRRPYEVKPLKSSKKDFAEGGFEKALQSIKEGKVNAEKIIASYNLTDEQLILIKNK